MMATNDGVVTVLIPSALRRYSSGKGELRLTAVDVRSLLEELRLNFPDVHRSLCNERGEPRPHINIFVNQDHVRDRDGLDTKLRPGDEVSLLPAVSGGSLPRRLRRSIARRRRSRV